MTTREKFKEMVFDLTYPEGWRIRAGELGLICQKTMAKNVQTMIRVMKQ